jgi:hypothetical protein
MNFLQSVALLRRKGYQVVLTLTGAKLCFGGSSGWDSYTKPEVIALAKASRCNEAKHWLKRVRRKNKQELAQGKELLTDKKVVKGCDPWCWD